MNESSPEADTQPQHRPVTKWRFNSHREDRRGTKLRQSSCIYTQTISLGNRVGGPLCTPRRTKTMNSVNTNDSDCRLCINSVSLFVRAQKHSTTYRCPCGTCSQNSNGSSGTWRTAREPLTDIPRLVAAGRIKCLFALNGSNYNMKPNCANVVATSMFLGAIFICIRLETVTQSVHKYREKGFCSRGSVY